MFKIGNVVMAKAGKEKGQLFIIVGKDDKYAYLSDGKRLKTTNPKKKSYKHIQLFSNEALSESDVLDKNARANALIRKFLARKRSESCQKMM